MKNHGLLKLIRAIMSIAVLAFGINTGVAQQKTQPKKRLTHADRQAAAKNAKAKGFALPVMGVAQMALPGAAPHYFSHPNYANSPLPVSGASINVGNPLAERARATDRATDVFVIVPRALPTGVVQSFRTLNQASPGLGFAPSAGFTFRGYILRPAINTNQYHVLFDSGPLTVPALADPAVSEIAVFPLPNVAVQAGDILAFYGRGIPFSVGGTDKVHYPVPTAPVVNSTVTVGAAGFPSYPEARTYSFSAQALTGANGGAITTVGNPLVERSRATDSRADVFVVLPGVLPDGLIQSFETLNQASAGLGGAPSAGLSFRAYVLRPTVNPNQYSVVFDSGPLTVPALANPAVNEIATYPVPNVAVQAGDVLAFYGRGIPFDKGTVADIVNHPAPTAPTQSSTITLGSAGFPVYPDTRMYSFSAQMLTGVNSGALVTSGNPLVERLKPTDSATNVFVVVPRALPAGRVQSFQTLNQASAGLGFASSAGLSFRAYILRPAIGPNQYTVVFDSGPLTVPPLPNPAVSQIATFPAPNVAVQAGDILAFYGRGIPFQPGVVADIVTYPVPTPPLQNSTITVGGAGFPMYPESRTYSFSAQVLASTVSSGIRKFVDGLAGLGPSNQNNLGQYISVAVPDQSTFPGSDYYEIAVVEYQKQMHSDLPPTKLRGYVQLETPVVQGSHYNLGNGRFAAAPPQYLGATIAAVKDRPVRIKFHNFLPTGAGGNLFIPVDTTVMGSGMTAIGHGLDPATMDPLSPMCSETGKEMMVASGHCYPENRATLHLHGGISPWISDGTPHQWITPANETTPYPKGVSVVPVPDMPVPEAGTMTFYYTNQQSARLMFYHDHAWGITRLNVYAGEAAGYLLTDPTEQALTAPGGALSGLGSGIPLIIQDKTFVPGLEQLALQDDTWDITRWGGPGSLWVPHVYSPAQNPGDPSGVNQFGRWAYGPWFWPPTTNTENGPVDNPYHDAACNPDLQWCEPSMIPGTPFISMGMESFNDTPVVNGTAYPTVTLQPRAYRFRILNAANDRFFNLSLYKAADAGGVLCDSANPTPAPEITGVSCSEVALNPTEVAAALLDPAGVFPTPLPGSEGPNWIQIANEGGFLPAPVVIPPHITTWVTDPTVFNAGNIDQHSLLLAPAERADVVVDFSQYAGQTLILYNDAPAAFPARDPRYDYYTGNPDLQDTGGAPSTLRGYGPNTRTIMQIKIANAAPAAPFNLGALQAAFAHHGDGSGVFESGQNPIIVGQGQYNSAYGTSYTSSDGLVQIFDKSLTFRTVPTGTPLTIPLRPKMIQDEMGEAFELEYGRMSGFLGVETPNAQAGLQNMILHPYTYPPDEIIDGVELPPGVEVTPIASADDGTQIWKITHNGVDTHPIHWHLYEVQVLNRVGWDGIIRKPDPNELGWKDTLRVSPLEDTVVALRPIIPQLPSGWNGLPNSIRLLDPSMPEGAFLPGANTAQREADGLPLMAFNPQGEPVDIVNHYVNFGWEYVWHCHILSHEEMDMMHAQVVGIAPAEPTNVSAVAVGNGGNRRYDITWTDNSKNETAFVLERRAAGSADPWVAIAKVESSQLGVVPFVTTGVGAGTGQRTYSDPVGNPNQYEYRVYAINVVGDVWDYSNPLFNEIPAGGGWPTLTLDSRGGTSSAVAAPTGLLATAVQKNATTATVTLSWTDNSSNERGFLIQRANDAAFSLGVVNATVGADIATIRQDVVRGRTFYYRILAFSDTTQSGWSNTASVITP